MRRVDPRRRDALLQAAAAYLLRHGVAGMSLRPMAAAIRTSARLLIYHFGTKERLLIDAMGVIRAQARGGVEAMLRDALVDDQPGDLGDLVRGFWRWCRQRSLSPAALRGPASRCSIGPTPAISRVLTHWIDLLTGALRPAGRDAGVSRPDRRHDRRPADGLPLTGDLGERPPRSSRWRRACRPDETESRADVKRRSR
jgi:AcrR family transcriptional regulator